MIVGSTRYYSVRVVQIMAHCYYGIQDYPEIKTRIYKVFGLKNKLVHHFFTSYFFVWFIKYNELIHHHLIFMIN